MSPEIAAEAAVWVARLHGPGRTPELEQACRNWQALSEQHRLAFERCTETWLEVGGVTLGAYAKGAAREGRAAPSRSPARRRFALAAGSALALGGTWICFGQADVYETGIGEQRTVVLADGTRMTLSTGSRAKVRYEAARRRVEVPAGEALFEVAKDPRRPFVVGVGGAQVVATGTAFVVRSLPTPKDGARELSVTLLEGQVIVSPGAGDGPGSSIQGPITMKPGERLRVGAFELDPLPSGGAARHSQGVQLDRPGIDQVLAWKRGDVVFADAPLPQALAEMNRYCSAPILVTGAGQLEALRVSGRFRAGDNAGFAAALAELHGLRVDASSERIELSVK